MYLNDNQIAEIIVNYVNDNRYTQGILLDGEWGCGKTYFVKEKLIDRLKQIEPKRDILYISLYGIRSADQIKDQINSKIYENIIVEKIGEKYKNIGMKGFDFLSIIGKNAIKKYFDIDKEELPKISDLKNINDNVIIFDDLERCNMNINDLLGSLNHLVEHTHTKVIIVANQSEMGSLSENEDLPNKYSVVLNKRLKLNKEKNVFEDKTEYDDTIDKNKLEELTRTLFSDDSQYTRIKEKLIGLTIYYHNDLEEIYSSLVKKYVKCEKAIDYLENKKNTVLDIFKENNHQNIRTFIFSLIAFDKFYQTVDKIQFSPKSYLEKQKIDILKYTFESSIRIKTGKYKYQWNNGTSKYKMIYWDDKVYSMFGKKILGYQFIDDYLLYQKYNEKEIINDLQSIMQDQKDNEMKRKENESLYINILDEWWKLEDDEVITLLEVIKKELQYDKYTISKYRDIIINLIFIKRNGFEFNIEDYIDKIVSNIRGKDIDNYKNEYLEISSTDKNFCLEYNQLIKPIIDILNEKSKKKKLNINDFIINDTDWHNGFADKCKENKNFYESEYCFLGFVSSNDIIDKIKNSKTKDIYCFIDGIKTIYSFSNLNDFYKADQKIIEEILDGLNQLNFESKTKNIAIKDLKQVLEDSLSKIKL